MSDADGSDADGPDTDVDEEQGWAPPSKRHRALTPRTLARHENSFELAGAAGAAAPTGDLWAQEGAEPAPGRYFSKRHGRETLLPLVRLNDLLAFRAHLWAQNALIHQFAIG